MDRLQKQVHSLEGSLSQAQASFPPHTTKVHSELARMRAELADAQGAVSQLQRKLQEEQAQVLMLKESQGGSNKASDVIHALESQVTIVSLT